MHRSPTSPTRPGRRGRALTLGALTLAVCAGTLGAPAPAAPASQEIKPAALARGADSTIPYFDGATIVADGERIPTRLRGHRTVLGTEDDGGFLVSAQRSRRTTIARISPDGAAEVVVRFARPAEVVASPDLSRVVLTTTRRARTTVAMVPTQEGGEIRQRNFPGYVQTVAAGPARVLVSQGQTARTGTWWWNPTTNRVRKISDWTAYRADLASDRLALMEGDPYQDACQRVVRLSAPKRTVWRSCTDRVDAFSPTGFMATVHILSDGLGPAHVALRRPGGRVAARFHTRGWFGDMAFEGPRALMVHTVGRAKAAWVRCLPSGCERASELEPRPEY